MTIVIVKLADDVPPLVTFGCWALLIITLSITHTVVFITTVNRSSPIYSLLAGSLVSDINNSIHVQNKHCKMISVSISLFRRQFVAFNSRWLVTMSRRISVCEQSFLGANVLT